MPYKGDSGHCYHSGKQFGERLLAANAKEGWCLIHVDISSLKDRCRGMEVAFSEIDGAEYMGVLRVPNTDQEDYRNVVEAPWGRWKLD